MTTYILLSRIAPGSFEAPKDFKRLAEAVSAHIKKDCPGLAWRSSYATFGRFDVVDVVETDDPKLLDRAVMIIRSYGRSSTETLVATPWREFIDAL